MTVLDPYTAEGTSPELMALLCSSPPVETLLGDVLRELRPGRDGRPGSGLMRFEHYGLRGPPGRVHGGLQCIARTLLVADAAGWSADELTCSALWVRLGAPLGLREDVPFTYVEGRGNDGHRYLSTRCLATPRLDAALRQLDRGASEREAAMLRAQVAPALASPLQSSIHRFGFTYEHTRTLTVLRATPAELSSKSSAFARFVRADGMLSRAIVTYLLDNAAAVSRIADIEHPCFTTRLAFYFSDLPLGTDQPLVFAAERARRPAIGARARTVRVGGAEQGTETAFVWAARADLAELYAWGWVDTHPM